MSKRPQSDRDATTSRTRWARPQERPTIRVSGLVHTDDTLLLVRQTRGSKDHWLLPGGAVELGETVTEALEREILEECGLCVQADSSPIALVQTISPDAGRTRHLIHLIFEVRLVDAQGQPLAAPLHAAPGDPAIKELRWVGSDEVQKIDIHPPIHDLLVSWMECRASHPTAPLPFVATGSLWAEE